MASTHSKLERVRKPTVHIKYEVETERALVEKELSSVVGVMGDFSGEPTEPLKSVRERKFIQINRDNFDEVLARLTPGLEFRIEKTLANNGTELPVSLKFAKIDDFAPASIVAEVPALKSLIETRNQLRDLLSKADRSGGLEALLERVLQNKTDLKKLGEELKLNPTSPHTPSTDGTQ